MKHNVYGKHLGRDKNQRQALFRGLIRSLFLEGSITTTEAKYKSIKGLCDRLISKARDKSNASKNVIYSMIPQKEVSEKLIKDIAPRYKNRTSGFVSAVRLGMRRGDGAMMVKMSLMPGDQIKSDKSDKSETPAHRNTDIQISSGSPKKIAAKKTVKKTAVKEKK